MKPDLHKFTDSVQPLTAMVCPELPGYFDHYKIDFYSNT
jgi:hypothetical protein